jgi:hypothetical protein
MLPSIVVTGICPVKATSVFFSFKPLFEECKYSLVSLKLSISLINQGFTVRVPFVNLEPVIAPPPFSTSISSVST